MTGRQKILQVLEHIKRESEINPNPSWVEFVFNTSLAGAGIVYADEEARILEKLSNEKVLEIYTDEYGERKINYVNYYENMAAYGKFHSVYVAILPMFYWKHLWYKLISQGDNNWNIINPFWILWQLVKGIVFLVDWFWNKSRVATLLLGTLGALLAYDWSLAWKNLKTILDFLRTL